MYAIIIYDASVKRVDKYKKLLRQYLFHIQNSAFEGEITSKNLSELTAKLKTINIKQKDSVIIYTFHNSKYISRIDHGPKKGVKSNVI